jgi:hypothetical protein
MSKLFLEEIDSKALQEAAAESGARRAKRELIKQGYTWMLSIYGAIYNNEDDTFSYRRIEVLSDDAWDRESILIVYSVFSGILTPFVYSVWAYNYRTQKLKLRGGFN